MEIFHHPFLFPLEHGGSLPEITLAYHTFGRMNENRDNVIWICHALTANSDAPDWWPGMVGPGKFYDPEQYFIICANYLGSCYGSTGPLSVNPQTGRPWYREFPLLTIRDMVAALDLLRVHLGIEKIHTVTGGSIGGHQAMEWAIMKPELFRHLVLMVTCAVLPPWAIAFNQAQRMAIEADPTYMDDTPAGGLAGMKAARAVALLSYRNSTAYNKTQQETDPEKIGGFRASSYQSYQGEKLARRFNAYSYHLITRIMDTHHVGRSRSSAADALGMIRARTLAIGISSDILFPLPETKFLADHIPGARYGEIHSDFGHDGFLLENEQLATMIGEFYKETLFKPARPGGSHSPFSDSC